MNSDMETVLENALECYLGRMSDIVGTNKAIWGVFFVSEGVYDIVSSSQYWNVVVLGDSNGIQVRSAGELALRFAWWKSRRDILNFLKVDDAYFWWTGLEDCEIDIDKDGGYYVVKYRLEENMLLNKEVEEKLGALGLCGDRCFRLPMDSYREFMGLLG